MSFGLFVRRFIPPERVVYFNCGMLVLSDAVTPNAMERPKGADTVTELFDRFFALMETRRSLRDYSGPAVTEQEKDAILQAGHLAPTAGNMSLYSVIQIENQEIKKKSPS